MDEAHSFHGLATFYRAFLSNIISKTMAPIAYYMKNVQFSLTGARRKAYKEVKQLMMEAPVPRCQSSPREVTVNASHNGIGGVLSQWVMHFSKSLKQRSST